MDITHSPIARKRLPNRATIVRNEHDKAIARRNRRKNSRRVRPESRADVHECEVYKVIAYVFGVGVTLPDDDYGRDVLYEVLNQMALRHADIADMRDVALDLLPEIDDDDSLDNVIKQIGGGHRRRADQLARILGVTFKIRVFLDLRGIGACDVSKKWRDAIQAQKEAADKRWKREHVGAAPHAQSAARNKPWEKLGISKATYHRRLKAAVKNIKNTAAENTVAENTKNSPRENAKNSSAENDRETVLATVPSSYSSTDKSVSAEIEHAGEASDHIGEPALPQPDPDSVVSALPATDGADLSDEERARRHLIAVASAAARSPDPERWQHLIVAASSAWSREQKR